MDFPGGTGFFGRAVLSGNWRSFRSSQIVNIQTAPGSFQVQTNSVEADWDDESGRVEVRVEIFVTGGAGIAAGVSQIRYWVTILAQIAD